MLKTKSNCRIETGVRVLEYAPVSVAKRVDRNAGVIYGVKIIGHKSKWGHEYEQGALREAVPLYEHRPVNIDHHVPQNDHDFRRFGEIRTVRSKPDGLYGDLHYLKSHPLAPMVAERAERFPGTMGMSHDATGTKVYHPNGDVTINKIQDVRSVDLVCEGATTKGLFESSPTRRLVPLDDVPPMGASPEALQRFLQA